MRGSDLFSTDRAVLGTGLPDRRGTTLRQRTLAVGLCLLMTTTAVAARLRPEAESGWTKYVVATERRIAGELSSSDRFLALDFTSSTAADHRALLAGEVVVHAMETRDAAG